MPGRPAHRGWAALLAGVVASTPTPARADDGEEVPWIERWAPTPHMAELGIYVGILFPSRDLELFEPRFDLPQQGFTRFDQVAADLGARVGYFPLRFFGIELEGGAMPTNTVDDRQAVLWTVRGHVIGQVGLWSITPFLLAGASALGVSSDRAAVGNDVDPAIHVGAGIKAYLSRYTQLRFDARDNISARRGVEEGVINSWELLLGLSVTLGRKGTHAARRRGDRDQDGFLDDADRCPDVPGEAPDGCPRVDSDGDGFFDVDDACPETPGVGPDGCPPSDRDHDNIIDVDDGCPDEPETLNGFEDDDGCPDEMPSEIEAFRGVLEGVRFELDSATITQDSRPVLDQAVSVLERHPSVHVEISGHTDSSGDRDYNMDLSQQRADAVKQYLVDHGIDASRMETRGAGPDEPISSNATPRGRAQNRRIEFEILAR